MERNQSFKNDISRLFREYPFESIIAFCSLILVLLGTIWGINYTIYLDRSLEVMNENHRLQLEIEDLENELIKYNGLDLEEGLIYRTEEYLYEGESISILNGEITIIASSIYQDSINLEFSFLDVGIQSMDERYKEGSISKRVDFKYKGKGYFIVINKLSVGSVKFSVHEK